MTTYEEFPLRKIVAVCVAIIVFFAVGMITLNAELVRNHRQGPYITGPSAVECVNK